MNARMLARMSSTDGAFCGCRREKPESCMAKKRRRMHVPEKGTVLAREKAKQQQKRAKRFCRSRTGVEARNGGVRCRAFGHLDSLWRAEGTPPTHGVPSIHSHYGMSAN